MVDRLLPEHFSTFAFIALRAAALIADMAAHMVDLSSSPEVDFDPDDASISEGEGASEGVAGESEVASRPRSAMILPEVDSWWWAEESSDEESLDWWPRMLSLQPESLIAEATPSPRPSATGSAAPVARSAVSAAAWSAVWARVKATLPLPRVEAPCIDNGGSKGSTKGHRGMSKGSGKREAAGSAAPVARSPVDNGGSKGSTKGHKGMGKDSGKCKRTNSSGNSNGNKGKGRSKCVETAEFLDAKRHRGL